MVRHNPFNQQTDDRAFPPAGFEWLRGYTGHEHLDSFGLINMNARLYDPKLGRMLSVDNYVSAPGTALGYNRYAYAMNNPVVYTDPSGNFIQFFLDLQYRIQKLISPVAFKLNLDFGTHGKGIGVEGSVGIPQLSLASYRYEADASYYLNRVGGYGAGWQVRDGGEWSSLGLVRYGGMRYRDYNGDGLQADQVVHTLSYGIPFLEASYSNDTKNSFPWADYVPLIPKLRDGNVYDQSDGLRTASGYIRAGIFEFGFFLHTRESSYLGYDADGNWSQLGGSMGRKGLSKGIIYFGIGGLKMGWDQESIRHFIQNRVAHDGNWNPFKWMGILNGSTPNQNNGNYWPWVPLENRGNRFVFQFGGF